MFVAIWQTPFLLFFDYYKRSNIKTGIIAIIYFYAITTIMVLCSFTAYSLEFALLMGLSPFGLLLYKWIIGQTEHD